ncbi:MAG: type II secretion system protein N [Rubrivivax sp.]|nr:type II secretion system protein N [Rubrivivax sp.]
MSGRWWTLGIWALAAGSAVAWGFKVFVTPIAAPSYTQTAVPAAALRGDLTRLLGADAPPPVATAPDEPTADARFQLVGVVSARSPRAAKEGLALIAVDGKPPKAFRVGAVVDGTTVLQSVAARGVTLGPRDGAAVVALNLAPPAAAATGVLPGLGGGGSPPALRPLRPSPGGVAMRAPVRPEQADQVEQDAEPPPPPVPPMQGVPTR